MSKVQLTNYKLSPFLFLNPPFYFAFQNRDQRLLKPVILSIFLSNTFLAHIFPTSIKYFLLQLDDIVLF